MGVRVPVIIFFCAIGTTPGGITGPLVFTNMVETGEPFDTAIAFSIRSEAQSSQGLMTITRSTCWGESTSPLVFVRRLLCVRTRPPL